VRSSRGRLEQPASDLAVRHPVACCTGEVAVPRDRDALAELLARAGFVAAADEAQMLLARAAGDSAVLDALVARRLTGEPLAWIIGTVRFCGLLIKVNPGVYVPRPQSEALARMASQQLPASGIAVEICAGSGAIARVLMAARPSARVVASDLDERAVTCAIANGVESYEGDLFAALPPSLQGRVDVVVGVVPYVATAALPLLQRDTFTFESAVPYDGGIDGTDILRRALDDARCFLRPGGVVVLELGGEQDDPVRTMAADLGYVDITLLYDDAGDVRGISAARGPR
jgi:release factor glutamine methyltransferase